MAAADLSAAAVAEDINFLINGDTAKQRPPLPQLQELIQDPRFFKLPQSTCGLERSKTLDKLLGYKIPKIEQKLLKKYRPYFDQDNSGRKNRFQGGQTWIGLHPQVLQTPYHELSIFFQLIKAHDPARIFKRIVDIGAGYGRVGIVMQSIFPECQFVGYEIINERLNEGQRVFEKLEIEGQCRMQHADLSETEFVPLKADIYFIYDFSDISDIRKILGQIIESSDVQFPSYVIAKGDFIQPLLARRPEFESIIPKNSKRSWDILQVTPFSQ